MSALHLKALALVLAAAAAGQASAQEREREQRTDHTGHAAHAAHATQAAHAGHDEHRGHDHRGSDDRTGHAGHEAHASKDAGSTRERPATPIPALTDADRAAAFPPLRHHGMQHGSGPNAYLLFNRLEAWDNDRGSGQAWEAEGWLGGDTSRLWLRSEGQRSGGTTGKANLELLYGRSVSPWWDVLAGVRHDFAPGDSRDWLAVGVQGLAPYNFEVSATAWLGESGRSMLGVEVEHELLLTNRLILQPVLEATAHGKADPARGTGSGLSTVEAGLRLRYEVDRRFAPYIGLAHERAFGDTADLRRAAGRSTRSTQFVAGIRFWF